MRYVPRTRGRIEVPTYRRREDPHFEKFHATRRAAEAPFDAGVSLLRLASLVDRERTACFLAAKSRIARDAETGIKGAGRLASASSL
jgi:hypothetical protein